MYSKETTKGQNSKGKVEPRKSDLDAPQAHKCDTWPNFQKNLWKNKGGVERTKFAD